LKRNFPETIQGALEPPKDSEKWLVLPTELWFFTNHGDLAKNMLLGGAITILKNIGQWEG
jgi:hypothetical protein